MDGFNRYACMRAYAEKTTLANWRIDKMAQQNRNTSGLKPFTSGQDREQARINGAKGGRKSGETKRRRKLFAEAYETLLSKGFVDRNGNEVMGIEALAAKTFQQAMDGDLSALKHIQASVGEAPVQRVETVEISQEAYDNVRKMLEDV